MRKAIPCCKHWMECWLSSGQLLVECGKVVWPLSTRRGHPTVTGFLASLYGEKGTAYSRPRHVPSMVAWPVSTLSTRDFFGWTMYERIKKH